jgi:protein-S-isoprenylcysteine O-methyltransferase Ste14
MTKVLDFGERLFLLVLSGLFLSSLVPKLASQPMLIVLAISETLPVFLILIRRKGAISTDPMAFAVALAGTAAPLLARPDSAGSTLLPGAFVGLLMVIGLCVNISAKLALWRSFGLIAANRGVRRGGPYRLVRHPMYLGYFLTQLGFLFANPTLWNVAIYLIAWSLQLVRIREEEKFLMQDESYRELATRVRFRLVPGLY